jgi:DNA-binding transcriptional MerR regulator
MRISELSRRARVPTSTIKFYIREGLIPAGERSQRNQAEYDEKHLQRLDLIGALRDVADLPLDVVRTVLEQDDKPWGEGDPVGAAIDAIYCVPERDRSGAERDEYERTILEVSKLLRGLDWVLPEASDAPHHINAELLADAIMQMRRYLDPEYPVEALRGFAEAAWLVSEAAFASNEDRVPQPGDDLVDPTRGAILGMLLMEPILMGLVRSALAMRSMHISSGTPLPPVKITNRG